MKKRIIICVLFTVLPLAVMAQESNSAFVEYKVYTNREFVYESLSFSTDTVKGILKFNPKRSSFQLDTSTVKRGQKNINRIFAGGDDLYYFDSEENEYLQQTTKLKKTYRIILDSLNWTVTKEQKLIDDYLCFKAVRKMEDSNGDGLAEKAEVIAWFTPEIPYPFGPSKYGGLPGLIIQCEYGNTIIKLNKIDWKEEEVEISRPDLGEEITFEEFKKIAKQEFPNF